MTSFAIPSYLCYKFSVLSRALPPPPRVRLLTTGLVCVLNWVMTESTKAREKLNTAEHGLNSARKHLDGAKGELVDLFDPTVYGAEGEWKKLHNTCLKKDTGE